MPFGSVAVVGVEYVTLGMYTVLYASQECTWLSGQDTNALANRVVFLIRCWYSPVWDKSAALKTPSVFDAAVTHFLLMVGGSICFEFPDKH
eukprot:scaffold11034_cov32-Attheya_sp.AAC.6